MECDLQMHLPIPVGPAVAASACGGPSEASLILGPGAICAPDGACQASFGVSGRCGG